MALDAQTLFFKFSSQSSRNGDQRALLTELYGEETQVVESDKGHSAGAGAGGVGRVKQCKGMQVMGGKRCR